MFSRADREVSSIATRRIILEDYSDLIQSKIDNLRSNYEDADLQIKNKHINKNFIPSKAAQNCLNFIKREDERAMLSEPVCDDVYNIIRVINIKT